MKRYALAALSGALYAFGFAGWDQWALSFIAFVPLFLALEIAPSGGVALKLAWVCGTVANGLGHYWVVTTLQEFGKFPLPVCFVLALLLFAYQGGQCAVFGWLLWHAKKRNLPWLIAVPALWLIVEGVYPVLFQNYYGNSLHVVLPLIQMADLGGPLLVSALLLLCNAGVYALLRAMQTERKLHAHALLAMVLAVAGSYSYGLWRIEKVRSQEASSTRLTLGLVQANMGIIAKRQDPLEGLRRHIEQSLELEASYHPDLIVWPESAYMFFLPDDVKNVRAHVVGRVQTPVLFGGLARRNENGKIRLYNTAFITDAAGNLRGTYDKTYLLAFGEYLPFGEMFPSLYDLSPHSGRFSPGNHVHALPLNSWKISTLICYEDILPRFVRRSVLENHPHLLVNVTNDAWFGDTIEPWTHLALSKFRAVEHHRYLVRSTNSGVSAIIDPTGAVTAHTQVFTRENLKGSVALMSSVTFYEVAGDWPLWVALVAMIFFFTRACPKAAKGSAILPKGQAEKAARSGQSHPK